MSKLVTIYGGSGFVGRYIARRMAKEGWRVRVAVRRPNEAIFVKPYGVVGQVCVGVLNSVGKNTFSAVQSEGATRVAAIAAKKGITKMVHISAIGADAEGDSEYQRTKAFSPSM